jgi:hypothetical protein
MLLSCLALHSNQGVGENDGFSLQDADSQHLHSK